MSRAEKSGFARWALGWPAVFALVALCALATFAIRTDSAQAQGDTGGMSLGGIDVNYAPDDCENGPPGGNNDDDECCEEDFNGPPGNNDDDECEEDEDECEFGAPGGHNDDCDDDDDDCHFGPSNSNNNHDDCDDDDDDDCDDRHDNDRRGGRDRDDCDRDDDDCDRWGDKDRRDRCRCDDDHSKNRHDHDRDNRDNDCDDEEGKITISKDADPSHSGSFSFSGDLGSFSLGDNDSKTWRVDEGFYTVTEKESSGWELTSITCSGNGTWNVDLNGNRVRISIDDGEHVSCEFNNEAPGPVVYQAPLVQPTPIIVFVPVPAPQPVVRAPEPPRVVQEAPRQVVAALPRTGYGPDAQENGMNLAMPLGAMGALLVAGAGYAAVRRVRDTD